MMWMCYYVLYYVVNFNLFCQVLADMGSPGGGGVTTDRATAPAGGRVRADVALHEQGPARYTRCKSF